MGEKEGEKYIKERGEKGKKEEEEQGTKGRYKEGRERVCRREKNICERGRT